MLGKENSNKGQFETNQNVIKTKKCQNHQELIK